MTHVIQSAPTATPTATPTASYYPPLEQVTKPRVTTAEVSHYTNLAEQTWRIKACRETFPEGMRPIRVCGRLAWPTAGLKKLLGLQTGFADSLMLAAIAGLAMLVQAFAPGLIDLTGIAMLGAGVIGGRDTESRRYFDLSALAAAAQANGCTVHMHHDEDLGYPIYSVGNSNIGAREFHDYDAAMKSLAGGKFTEADCAAQAGAAIADNCLNGMLDLDDQTDHANLLAAALIDLATLKHHEHAAAGFAGAMVPVIEQGLNHASAGGFFDAERESEICNGPSNIEFPRPPLGSLGDCLAETAACVPMRYARITGCTEEFWRDIPADKPDTPWFVMEAVTAALPPAPVTIFISAGTPAATACEILKQVSKWLKTHGDELPSLTPREPEPTACDDEDVPF